MTRISQHFSEMQKQEKKTLAAYLLAGDVPDDLFVKMVQSLEGSGVNLLEIGVPFSDPMADGPVIAAAHTRALKHHKIQPTSTCSVTLDHIIGRLIPLVRQATNMPIVMMTYFNPVLCYGEHFFTQAASAGVDGVLIVDFPCHQEQKIAQSCQAVDMDPIFLYSLTTTQDRLNVISSCCSGFLYCVSVKGVTGASLSNQGQSSTSLQALDSVLFEKIMFLRENVNIPIMVGFGIKNEWDAKRFAPHVDGVVVGSAFVNKVAQWHQHHDTKLFVSDLAGLAHSIYRGLMV